jgi:hypothetical protein
MLICGTYPIRNAITVDFGVSTANANLSPSLRKTESLHPQHCCGFFVLDAHALMKSAISANARREASL